MTSTSIAGVAALLGPQHVGFSVNNGQQTVTGGVTFGTVWPGGQVLGETYDRVRINILPDVAGFLMFMGPDSSKSFTVLNGLQLVPIPAPGSAALCVAFGAFALRRRRQRAIAPPPSHLF
jgi:hypothetical protein